jgi:hypothetical protein
MFMMTGRAPTPSLTGAKIVDSESAAIPGRGDKISLHADHIGICKFDTREDSYCQMVVGALRKLLRKLLSTNEQPDRDSVCIIHSTGPKARG